MNPFSFLSTVIINPARRFNLAEVKKPILIIYRHLNNAIGKPYFGIMQKLNIKMQN
jgi:hypothetical protein